jgi:hypothetical protein
MIDTKTLGSGGWTNVEEEQNLSSIRKEYCRLLEHSSLPSLQM